MFENPFYNPNQEKIDEKIKSAISSLRSEIQSLISAKNSSASPERTIVKNNNFSLDESKKEVTKFAEQLVTKESPQFNYTTDAKYNGQDVRFAISGQVLTTEEEAQFGNINYIDLGGEGSCEGLHLYTKTIGTDPNIVKQVWVSSGSVGDEVPDGLDPLEGKLIAQDGFGYVWVKITINENNGEITSIEFDRSETIPSAEQASQDYFILGYYKYEEDQNGNSILNISNYGCGSLNVEICRQWFVLVPPFYKINLYR